MHTSTNQSVFFFFFLRKKIKEEAVKSHVYMYISIYLFIWLDGV